MTVAMLRSTRYTGIANRQGEVEQVKMELQAVIDAQPTQIHPDDREGYLTGILADMTPQAGAVWTGWPEDVLLLALTATRILGRNPMGSKCMLTTTSIRTLLFHAALVPVPKPASASASVTASVNTTPSHLSTDTASCAPASASNPASACSVGTVDPHSPPATEALKVLANMLVLHPVARKRVSREGGSRAVVLALRGLRVSEQHTTAQEGEDRHREEGLEVVEGEDAPERVFLLGRLLFLMTAAEDALVKELVDEERVVDGLVHHLLSLAPVPKHYDALTELFKAANNIVGAYSTGKADWDGRLDPLIHCAILHLHLVPLTSLAPPLTHIIHTLFSTPLNARTAPLFEQVPDVAQLSPTSAMAALGLGLGSIIYRIGQIPGQIRGMAGGGAPGSGSGAGVGHHESNDITNGSANKTTSGTVTADDKAAEGELGGVSGEGTATVAGQPGERPRTFRKRMSFSSSRSATSPPQLVSALPTTAPVPASQSTSGSASGTSLPSSTSPAPLGRPTPTLPPLRTDPTALPRRVYTLLSDWMDRYLPSTASPDKELHSSSAIDEVLPPLLLLLAKACGPDANVEGRLWVKDRLLPRDLDRSEAAGELEKREGTLGGLLRLMGCTRFPASKDSAGELIWVVCDSDPATMSAEIGYGNAAGFLFHKGITQPPPGKITEIPDEDPSANAAGSTSTGAATTGASTGQPSRAPTDGRNRNPITSLVEDRAAAAAARELANMTQEEKEREAERLFVLFKRMESNPVLSLGAETGSKTSREEGGAGPDVGGSSSQESVSIGEGKGEGEGRGKGKAKSIEELMREKLTSGEHARMDAEAEEEERKEREAQEERDEEEAVREMAAYRARRGR